MMRRTLTAALAALAFGTVFNARGCIAQASRSIANCTADQLALSNDSSHAADLDGMSHAGTLLVLRNAGNTACTLMPFVPITLSDDTHTLDAKAVAPGARFMHHGPMMPLFILQPGDSASASMRWVDGSVYDNSVCINPTRLTATLYGHSLTIPFSARICGDKTKGITFEVSHFSSAASAGRNK